MFNKSKAWAVGLLIAVAAAGFAAGIATQSWASHRGRGDGYTGYLTRELGLTAAQHDSVAAIVRRHRPAMHAIFMTVRPQIDSERARVSDEIRPLLTSTQQADFQRLLDRDRAERARADSAAVAPQRKP